MRPMRRVDRKTSQEDAVRILQESDTGFLSTINEDGSPYCVPMAFVYLDGALYFHCARAGQKLDNLQRDARACFTCVLHSKTAPAEYTIYFASCVAEGTVHVVESEEERLRANRALTEKYCPDHLDCPAYDRMMRGMPAIVILRMDLSDLCGKANKGQLKHVDVPGVE